MAKKGIVSDEIFFDTRGKASKKISRMPVQDQTKFSVFEVKVRM